MSHSRPQASKDTLEEHPQHRTVGPSGTTPPARRCSPGQQVPGTTDGLGGWQRAGGQLQRAAVLRRGEVSLLQLLTITGVSAQDSWCLGTQTP